MKRPPATPPRPLPPPTYNAEGVPLNFPTWGVIPIVLALTLVAGAWSYACYGHKETPTKGDPRP